MMASRNGYKLTWEEMVARDRATIERICADEKFAYYFFHVVCEPLFTNIMWTVFKNEADYDEIVDEIYVHLWKPGKNGDYWHNLLTFDYRTSLFDWIKSVGLRFFVNKRNEINFIPNELITNGIIFEILCQLPKSFYRKFAKMYLLDQCPIEEVCDKLDIEPSSFKFHYNKLARLIEKLVKNEFPEYTFLFFNPKEIVSNGDSEISYINIENKIDLEILVNMMPNERLKMVIKRLYMEDISPEDLSDELETPVSNIYNLRLRALDQLRDVTILSGEFANIGKFIFMLSDDRNREIAYSLFVKGQSYEHIIKEHSLTVMEFRRIKKNILSEINRLVNKENKKRKENIAK